MRTTSATCSVRSFGGHLDQAEAQRADQGLPGRSCLRFSALSSSEESEGVAHVRTYTKHKPSPYEDGR